MNLRKLIGSAALFILCPSAFGQSRISLVVTVTNAPVTSNTITINGVTRYFTNASSATTIATNLVGKNDSKTNLFRQFNQNWTFAGPLNLVDQTTNSFKIVGTLGGSLSASVSGTWATLSLSTQSGPATYTALYPLENMAESTDRVNQASSLIYGLSTYSTNALATNSTAGSNFVNKGASPPQRVRGHLYLDSFAGTNTGFIMPSNAVAGYALIVNAAGVGTWQMITGGSAGTNAAIPIMTNGVSVTTIATNSNYLPLNNVEFTSTNASGNVSIGIGIKSNLTFVTASGTLILGNFGNQFGLSNVTLGRLVWYIDDPGSDEEFQINGNVLAAGTLYGTNIHVTAIQGSGNIAGISTSGELFRTNVSGGSGTVGGSTHSIQWNTNSTLVGDTNFQYFSQDNVSGDDVAASLKIHYNGYTNTVDGLGFGSDSATEVSLRVAGLPQWGFTTAGHFYPKFGNNNIGTPASQVDTNYTRVVLATSLLGVGVDAATPSATLQVSNAVGSATRPLAIIGTNDSGNGFIVSSNGSVGINTLTPSVPLDVYGAARINAGSLTISNSAPQVIRNSYSGTATLSGQDLHQRYRGDSTTPTAIQSGDFLGSVQMSGYGDTTLRGGVTVDAKAYGPFSDSSAPALYSVLVGRTNSGTVQQRVFSSTATRATNNVDTYFNSNIVVAGSVTLSDGSAAIGYGALTSKVDNLSGLATNISMVGTQSLPASSGTAFTNFARLKNTLDSQALDIGGAASSGTPVWLQVHDSSDLSVNYAMSLQPNGGKVGVGTLVPTAKVTISNDTSAASFAIYPSGSATPTLMTTNGNLGIGTPSPGAKLDVSDTDMHLLYSGGSPYYGASLKFTNIGGWVRGYGFTASNDVNIGMFGIAATTVTPTYMFIATNVSAFATPIMSFRPSGNVGIGLTTPVNLLDVEGAVAIGAAYSGSSTAPTDGLSVVGNVTMGTATVAGTGRLTIDGGGITFGTDNTYDIGASGANRPRSIYTAGSVSFGGNTAIPAASSYVWLSRGTFQATSDGVFMFRDNGSTGFNRLQLGGTTAAFPAIGRTNGDLVVFGAEGSFGGGSTNKLIVYGGIVSTGPIVFANSGTVGQVPTSRSDGSLGYSNIVALGVGTNFPPVTTTGTNIVVGTGVRKSLLMPTNQDTKISFNGTAILGEQLTLVITNTSAAASNILISFFVNSVASSYFDATVASNVAGFLVVSNSSRELHFSYNGTFWRLDGGIAKEMDLSVSGGLTLATNGTSDTVTLTTLVDTNSFIPTIVAGTGGANTNFVLQAQQPEVIINAFTNVSLLAVMGYNASRIDYVNVTFTNGSGSDRTFQFQQTTNSPRYASVYGTNAPVTITNMTAMMMSLRIHGTNVRAGYTYFPWP